MVEASHDCKRSILFCFVSFIFSFFVLHFFSFSSSVCLLIFLIFVFHSHCFSSCLVSSTVFTFLLFSFAFIFLFLHLLQPLLPAMGFEQWFSKWREFIKKPLLFFDVDDFPAAVWDEEARQYLHFNFYCCVFTCIIIWIAENIAFTELLSQSLWWATKKFQIVSFN